ncbi:MAG: SPOR domain-containing protein [Methylophilaceae bacterium]
MSKDYKPTPQKASTSKGSPFFTGLLIGLLIGVGASVWVTMKIKGDTSPFEDKKINAPSSKDLAAKSAKTKDKKSDDTAVPKEESPTDVKKTNDYDFYTILPETESTVTEQEIKDNAKTIKKDNYFLQVGAFPNEEDADNMKAKLALQGFEAVVQTATIPDKGTWHRVRVGPLNDIGQINKIRGDLTTAGFNTDLIKVHTETPPH